MVAILNMKVPAAATAKSGTQSYRLWSADPVRTPPCTSPRRVRQTGFTYSTRQLPGPCAPSLRGGGCGFVILLTRATASPLRARQDRPLIAKLVNAKSKHEYF